MKELEHLLSAGWPGPLPVVVPIREQVDVAIARRVARETARSEGCPEGIVGAIETAVSEVAQNIIVHAVSGELLLGAISQGHRRGICIVARDWGPGIRDLEEALRDGYSTGPGLGLGLPSARRLMDLFEVKSAAGAGTTISMAKWRPE